MATMIRMVLFSAIWAKKGVRPSTVRWPLTRRVHSGRQIAGNFGQKDSVVISFKDRVVLQASMQAVNLGGKDVYRSLKAAIASTDIKYDAPLRIYEFHSLQFLKAFPYKPLHLYPANCLVKLVPNAILLSSSGNDQCQFDSVTKLLHFSFQASISPKFIFWSFSKRFNFLSCLFLSTTGFKAGTYCGYNFSYFSMQFPSYYSVYGYNSGVRQLIDRALHSFCHFLGTK